MAMRWGFVQQIPLKAYSVQLVKPGITEASISSIYNDAFNHTASYVVDGNFTQQLYLCSHTKNYNEERAWLRIDLRQIFSIKSVKFWYRNDRLNDYMNTMRLRGYSIRVSNDSVLPPPESSCYRDPGNVTLPTVIEEECERTARYVWIYQDQTPLRPADKCPMLEICEVQVFGCKLGHYGETCTKTCGHCKNNAYCGISSGKCSNDGCDLPEFQMPLCKDCVAGKYSGDCSMACSEFCKHKICDRQTGACTDGCQRGYTGTHCNQISEPDTSSSYILDSPLLGPLCIIALLLCVSISIIASLLLRKRRPEMSSLQENQITNIYENINSNTTHETNVVTEYYEELMETNPAFK